jgi:hypothetical protein
MKIMEMQKKKMITEIMILLNHNPEEEVIFLLSIQNHLQL